MQVGRALTDPVDLAVADQNPNVVIGIQENELERDDNTIDTKDLEFWPESIVHFLLNKSTAEVRTSLHGKNLKCLRVCGLSLSAILTVASKSISVVGGLFGWIGFPVTVSGLLGASVVEGCKTGEWICKKYQWNGYDIAAIVFGAPSAIVAGIPGVPALALRNWSLGDALSLGQKTFFKENLQKGTYGLLCLTGSIGCCMRC